MTKSLWIETSQRRSSLPSDLLCFPLCRAFKHRSLWKPRTSSKEQESSPRQGTQRSSLSVIDQNVVAMAENAPRSTRAGGPSPLQVLGFEAQSPVCKEFQNMLKAFVVDRCKGDLRQASAKNIQWPDVKSLAEIFVASRGKLFWSSMTAGPPAGRLPGAPILTSESREM